MSLVLVTGATGFVGGHVTDALVAAGHRVRAAARGPAPVRAHESVVVPDVGPRTDWTQALAGVEVVVHLAAHVHDVQGDGGARHHEVNALGTAQLARAATAAGVRHFVLMSSAGVMGRSAPGRPLVESDPPAPEGDYARSKLAAEGLARDIGRSGGMTVTALRPPMIYGPHAPGNYARLVKLIERGAPLPLPRRSGKRSFAYVGNVAAAVLHAVESRPAGEFFVSDDDDATFAEFARELAIARGRRARFVPVLAGVLRLGAKALGRGADAARVLDPLQLDLTRIKGTGWKPGWTLRDGLRASAKGEGRPSS